MKQFVTITYLDARGRWREERLNRLSVADMMALYQASARHNRVLNRHQDGPNFSRGQQREAACVRRTARNWWKDVSRVD